VGTPPCCPNQARTKLALLGIFGSGPFSIREAAVMTKTGEETIRHAIRAGFHSGLL
jgi:hypothetical protein